MPTSPPARDVYHGVLARRSVVPPQRAWRSRVVPEPAEPRKRGPTLCATYRPASRWVPWRDLLWRVFEQDEFADSHALRALLYGQRPAPFAASACTSGPWFQGPRPRYASSGA